MEGHALASGVRAGSTCAMKRILVLSLAYYPHVGGAEVALKELTSRMPDIAFDIVTRRWSRDEKLEEPGESENVRIVRIDCGPGRFGKAWFQFAAARKAKQLHGKKPYDALWAIMAHSAGIPAGIVKAVFPDLPYLLTLQEGDPPAHIERVMRPFGPLFRQAFRRADALQAISTFLADWGKKMGFQGQPVVIPNGYSTVWFSTIGAENQNRQDYWRQHQLNMSDSQKILVTTSRLVRKNAIDDVIRAMSLIDKTIDAHFMIFGDGPERQSLQTLAEELGIKERVHFLGEISNTKVAPALRASDIFVRPSRSEGMGNSFIEAMAAGLPVIATQEGGIADFLFDAKRNPDKEPTGFAVDVDSPEQIAAAVKEILANPSRTAQVVGNARTMVQERYDWDHVAGQMRDLFNGFLGTVQ